MVNNIPFSYTIQSKGGYILMELKGMLSEQGIKEATGALMAISFEKNVKRVLYDAAGLSQSDKVRRQAIRYFRFVNQRMEKMASYIPNRRIYALAVFMSVLANTKNWKPFKTREKAIEWLLK
jgi:hypothetical protein